MAKKTKVRWLVVFVAVGGLYLLVGGNRRGPADKALAKHFSAMCQLAQENVKSPYAGVEKLSRYLGDHSPAMMQRFGELLVEIERIEDDSKHDQRARQAAVVLRTPLSRCEPTLERFFAAVEADPKAKQLLERRAERLGRTLEILFGAATQRGLPGPLRRLLLR